MTTCTRCHKRPPLENRKRCQDCTRYTQTYQAAYFQAQKAAGLCAVNGCKNPPRPHQTKCELHATLVRNFVARRAAIRKAAGLCPRCGNALATLHSHYCGDCKSYLRNYFKTRRENARKNQEMEPGKN